MMPTYNDILRHNSAERLSYNKSIKNYVHDEYAEHGGRNENNFSVINSTIIRLLIWYAQLAYWYL